MNQRNCTIQEAKTKALISCAVTAQLICAFVSYMQKVDFLMMWLIEDLALPKYNKITKSNTNIDKTPLYERTRIEQSYLNVDNLKNK